ncbi:MAG: hypothetical protein V3V62_05845 [bacterium]
MSGPELLLLGLVFLFVVCGFVYKLRNNSVCSGVRKEIENGKRQITQAKAKEKLLKDELQKTLLTQNQNMGTINSLKAKKSEIARIPAQLDRQLEELVAWCTRERISVNFERQEASRRAAPKGRRV